MELHLHYSGTLVGVADNKHSDKCIFTQTSDTICYAFPSTYLRFIHKCCVNQLAYVCFYEGQSHMGSSVISGKCFVPADQQFSTVWCSWHTMYIHFFFRVTLDLEYRSEVYGDISVPKNMVIV